MTLTQTLLELVSVLIIPGIVSSYPDQTQIPLSLVSSSKNGLNESETNIRPLVLWHGLGDSYASPGMLEFADLLKEVHPGLFVHSIYIEENLDADQRAGFFGNVDAQLELVAEQLANVKELSQGFDAIGFSQGGQFLRAYVERYNNPPINNLLTFGSQHMGISDLPLCRPTDLMCQLARRAARVGVYTNYAQNNLVQAQYFRNPDQLDKYLEVNKFLTSINNEIPETVNKTYAQNLISLNNLVLILFSDDKTVVPKESSWFGSYAASEGDANDKNIIPMKLQPTYLADTFGLRTLDERGGVSLEICQGEHMQVTTDCWEPLVRKFVGRKLTN